MSNQPILSHRPLCAEGDKEERTGREGRRKGGWTGQVGRVDSAHGFQVSVPDAYGGLK